MNTREIILAERTKRFVSIYEVGMHAHDAHQYLQELRMRKKTGYTPNELRADLIMSADALSRFGACGTPLLLSDEQTPFLVRIYLAIPWQERLLFTRIATSNDAHVVAQRFSQLGEYLKNPKYSNSTAFKEALEYTRALELAAKHGTGVGKSVAKNIESIVNALPRE